MWLASQTRYIAMDGHHVHVSLKIHWNITAYWIWNNLAIRCHFRKSSESIINAKLRLFMVFIISLNLHVHKEFLSLFNLLLFPAGFWHAFSLAVLCPSWSFRDLSTVHNLSLPSISCNNCILFLTRVAWRRIKRLKVKTSLTTKRIHVYGASFFSSRI